MRRKKEKEKKKANQVDENESASEKEKKVTSHPVMQMQAIFGNSAIERAVKKNDRFLRNNRKRRSRRLGDTLESFDIAPIYRFPHSPQVGIRMYQTKEQYHYDHRLYIPKKMQNHSNNEENVQGNRKENSGEFNKQTKTGSNFGLFHLDRDKELEETNSKAREHFSTQNHQNADHDKNDQNMSNHEMEESIQKKIKWGRFSFLLAYPILARLVRKKNKEQEKGKKGRKKSKISRFANRFSNKT